MTADISNLRRAEILTQALPYIRKYYNKVVVVKYGGNAMISPELKEQVMEDIVLLSLVGVKIVLVHGGGPEISEMLTKIGKKSEFVDGLRVTDRETVDIAQMVLAGKISKTLVNLIQLKGGRAMGICGTDGHMIKASVKDEKLGFVGKIEEIDETPIRDLLEKGYIPVVSTIGCDMHGNLFNINADTAAAYIAGAMGAECLITMTDIRGILLDCSDPSSLLPVVDREDIERLISEKVVSGGMIPKVECASLALSLGTKKVFIIDGRIPHAILLETLTDEGAGTMIVKHKEDAV